MSEKSKGTDGQDGAPEARLGRRMFLFRTLFGAVAAATVGAAVTATPAEAQTVRRVTDRDPTDVANRRVVVPRGGRIVRVTDRDPTDAAGRAVVARPRVTRVTDRDPFDRANRPVVRRAAPVRRRVTDADPFDRANRPVIR